MHIILPTLKYSEVRYNKLVVKSLLANVGDTRDAGSFPGSGRSPGGGYDNPSHILVFLSGEPHG